VCNSEKGRVGKSKIHSRFDLFFQFSKNSRERFGKLKINCQTKFSISISLEEIEKLFNSRENNGKRLWKEKETFRKRESC